MTKHKFAAGDLVTITPEKGSFNPPGVYLIKRTLPLAGRGLQYVAKSDMDGHDRVIDEARLRMAAASG